MLYIFTTLYLDFLRILMLIYYANNFIETIESIVQLLMKTKENNREELFRTFYHYCTVDSKFTGQESNAVFILFLSSRFEISSSKYE